MTAGPIRPEPSFDLDSPAEVAEMVRRFYFDVAQDALLGPIYDQVAGVDWATHIPKLTSFWCRALFGMPGYDGNVLRAHRAVNAKAPFRVEHFERWVDLFCETVDTGWVGPTAELAKSVARNAAETQCRKLVGTELTASLVA